MPDAINGFLEQTSGGAYSNSVDVAKQVLGGKENVVVTFKKDVVVPIRMESPAKAHTFWSVDRFIEYLQKYASENLVLLADPMTGEMDAVLDERAAKGFEVVSFQPLYHPLFKPWADWIGQEAGDIKRFAKFILAQRHVIVGPEPTQLAMALSQIRVSKKVEAAMGFGAESTNGVMVETKIKGQVQNAVIDLPETITIECPIYTESGPARMDVSLILEDDDGVTVQLISSDVEREKIAATQAMLNKVATTLDAVVSLGRVEHNEWSYIQGKKEKPY
jgi:hypothetical protein